ncbi:MAG: hypothetical protein IMZ41_00180 [Actinobacteria bacterium]|nr:hypothetical protein [Actinomycetota bacterium]
MNKEKRIWIALFLALALMLILSGCSGLPKTAKINITIEPNPVPYSSENQGWSFNIVLDESNGVGVTLSSLRLDEYNQDEQLSDTAVWGEEKIIGKFGSHYLSAFSLLQGDIGYLVTPGEDFAKYIVITIEGLDDNDNPIEATGRVDFLP